MDPARIKARIIPADGHLPNVERDALEAHRMLKSGGVVIVPTDVGYGLLSASAEGIDRAFAAKQRRPGHTLGIVGTYLQHSQLHVLSDDAEEHQRRLELTHVLTRDMGATLGIVGKLRAEHPRLQQLSAATLERCTKEGSVGIAVPEGPFLTELGRLNDEDGLLMVGSSANLTGQGQKYRVEDIEPEVLEAADLIVDYGLQKWQLYRRPGSNYDFYNMRLLRVGANYEVFRERMRKWAGVELPDDPEHKTDSVKPVGISINV
ncbi:uncharacterized protein N0V89_003040 [Didymosphaeria variabile]|uniref:Threonylcarbamoyl-AMP synthase n=1 Tax=Didymosphaeria variabile TaxID=1932322 RepID=A0A9W8XVY3_9PLEO|nr:uncharacterized protein N0V89_003040 [Didymosphaeria variabile]KAJ4358457.1 hypothetical protein N0V89_003040 [Didymosphaeria variabile]